MPGKASRPILYGQDIPYNPNDIKVQQYEEEKKSRLKGLRARMNTSKVPGETFAHKKAVEHHQEFCNWKLANKIYGMNRGRLRIF
jgi:hypothetical protein